MDFMDLSKYNISLEQSYEIRPVSLLFLYLFCQTNFSVCDALITPKYAAFPAGSVTCTHPSCSQSLDSSVSIIH